MSLQTPDVNALLHNMRAQILALTTQFAELQANPPATTPLVEKKFNKKVEVVTDPGTFEGDRVRFAEWWSKFQIWVKANWDAFSDDFEIKGYFKPQAERDWACQQICTFKQGNMRTDDFVTWFLALSIQGGLGNEHAVELLERNVNPHIAEQLYLQDMRSKKPLSSSRGGGRTTTKNNHSQRSPGSSNQKQNHSHGFQPFGLQPGQGAPMDISAVQGGQTRRFTCYSCGQEEHMAQQCPNGAQATQQKNNQGHQVHQLEAEKPDDWLNTLTGRSYNEIRAFFYDQQVAEMKAEGKEFGA
ncbi:hypothetical protein SERLA73DRAFT_71579 [Serpula lacrymans var. lacrymans S7.3]|uniref:CCHC-type domain-containing protein n=1 Tax=Serpula lacrymans var. lacrymans (strain S7.3) TaxID=936435 RepID=F8PRE6_SERL3|nr:hypothetical protein SERLA73DRAFT_71579 [Serpula lacrymans var. lacrymans S7.3]